MDWESSALLGLTVGAIHHVFLQYPNQKPLFTTISAYASAEGAFAVLLLGDKSTSLKFFQCFLAFSCVYVLSTLVLKTIYNVYFRHRGIPGKFWFKATDWMFYKLHQGVTPHIAIAKMHHELGDVIRLQPNYISFCSVEAMEDIYGRNSKCNKGEFYRRLLTMPDSPSSVATEIDKARHSFLRRLINPSFGPNSLRKLEPTMNEYFDEFIAGIENRAKLHDGIVEINEWFHNLAFDVAGALTLGEDFGALRNDQEHIFIKAIHDGFRFMNIFFAVPWLAQLLTVMPIPKKAKQMRYQCSELSRSAVQKCLKREASSEEKTILGTLQRAKDPETGDQLTFKELVSNADTLLIAGADTTAVTLTFALYFIVSNRRVWDRLSREIRSRFSAKDEINGQATAMIPYLDAVIYEALRIRPVAAAGQPRETPPDGATIGGRYVAGYTTVSSPTWGLMHDARYFSNPDSFIPERWTDADCGETCSKEAWIPFQLGPRNCVGKPLALMEMRISLARLIWHFDITLKEGQTEPAYDHITISAGKLAVRITPRYN